MSERITTENLLAKLKLHPREQTPAVCLIAGQEITRLRSDNERLRGLVRDSRDAHLELLCDTSLMSQEEYDNWKAATNAMLAPLSSLETARQAGGGK